MMIRGTRSSLARARMIRSARRSRCGKMFHKSSLNNTSSALGSTSKTDSTSTVKQAKKIKLYEKISKAADDMQKTLNTLIGLGDISTEEASKSEGEAAENTVTDDTAAESKAVAEGKADAMTEDELKKEIISGVKDFVEQYNAIYDNMDELGGSVNTVFLNKLKQLMKSCEDELKKTGVSINKDGTLSVTEKTLENADLDTLKSVYCKKSGIAGKLIEQAEYVENNATSTIQVLNRMYGTQSSYNKYGTSSSYYGSSGSWYNAIG